MGWIGITTILRVRTLGEACPRFVQVGGRGMSDNDRLSDGGRWLEVGGAGSVRRWLR